jgi:hypothetical protein
MNQVTLIQKVTLKSGLGSSFSFIHHLLYF